MQFPSIYQQGPKNMFFTWTRIFAWMANGLLGSLLSFFIIITIFGHRAFREDGQISGFEVFGATMYTAIIWVVNCQIALTISYFTAIQHFLIWGSIAMWYIFLIIFGLMSPTISTTAYDVLLEALAPSPRYWIATFLVAAACVFPYFAYIAFQLPSVGSNP